MNVSLSGSFLSLALLQSPLTPTIQFLQSKLSGANWPLFAGAGVLLLLALALFKRLMRSANKASAQQKEQIEEESTLRSFLDDASLGMGLIDRNEKILSSNAALQKLLGYEESELHATPFSNFSHPEDAHANKSLFNDLKEGERKKYILERRFYRKDGRLLWLREEVVARNFSSGTARRNAHGNFGAILMQDITREKTAEQELQVTREAIHNLYEVIVDRRLDLLEKMSSLLAMGCRRFNVETGVIGQIVAGGFEVLQVASPDERIRRGKIYERGTDSSDNPEPVTARHQRLHQTTESQSGGFAHDWRNFPFYSTADVEVFLSAPIQVLDRTFGVLCFSGLSGREEPFSPSDREFLQLMAQWLGGELERLQALAELETKQQALINANAQLEALATVDGLTGAKNRRAFDEQLEMEFRRARRYGTPLSLMLLDVDKFKQYNDTYGHLEGDEVLKTVAQILMDNVRVIDFVARYGGEEFVVLLPNTDADGAMILADRLRIKIENAPWPSRTVTASFGVASLNETITEGSQLTAEADRALYASKETGRNRTTHAHSIASAEP